MVRPAQEFCRLPLSLRTWLLGHWLFVPVAVGLYQVTPPPGSWPLVALLLLLAMGMATWKVELTIFQGRLTCTSAVVCLALLLQGPVAAMFCAAAGGAVSTLVRPRRDSWTLEVLRPPLYRTLFNTANCGLAAGLGGLASLAVPAVPVPDLTLTLRLAAFTGVYFLANTAGVAVALALMQGLRPFHVWRDSFFWTAPGYLAAGALAAGIAISLRSAGAWSWLLLPSMWLVYACYRLYLERLNLYRERQEQDRRHIEELDRLNAAIITSLATAIDSKDRYASAHPGRARRLAEALGRAAGLEGPELEAVRTAALVRDVGKLGVPDHILAMTGDLTPEETARIQTHVDLGVEILSPIPFPFPVVEAVRSHHERWDGTGYPHRLKGKEIPITGRVIALVDAFEALTAHRPYRRGMSVEEALGVIRAAAGSQFDPDLARRFVALAPEVLQEGEATPSPSEGGNALAWISHASAEIAAAASVARWLAEQDRLAEIVAGVAQRSLALLPADTAVVYLLEPGSTELRAAAVQGMHAERLAGMTVQVGEGLVGQVARDGRPRHEGAAAPDLARRLAGEEPLDLAAATAVPLVHGTEPLGVLAVYSRQAGAVEPHHLRVLGILAEHASLAIHTARRLEREVELACTDPLTGLANNRALMRHLDRLLRGAADHPGQERFAVLLLDLDRFKLVNDRLGHLEGDELLRRVGATLRAQAGSEDVVGRYAGDEFLLLLPGASREAALDAAERVRSAIDDLPAPRPGLWVGASVGVSLFPHDGADAASLIGAADARMYQDKLIRSAGRELCPPTEPTPSVR